jgi:hypothetical protein
MSYLGKAPADSALTAADITDGIVTTVKLADDAVTAAKVADGIIVNAAVSSTAAIDDTKIAPPYYAAVANLPTAADHHGRVAHAHSEGKMYYSHGGSWIALAKDSDLPTNPALLASTQTFSGTNTFSAPARGTQTTDNDGSFDLSVTNNFKCTPSGNITLTFTNPAAGQSGNIYLDNSGGHTVSSASATKIASADLTTISATGLYWLSYYTDGTNILVSTTTALT